MWQIFTDQGATNKGILGEGFEKPASNLSQQVRDLSMLGHPNPIMQLCMIFSNFAFKEALPIHRS